MVKVAPSILASDFSKLGEEVRDVINGGADYIHVDVMDGHFVPNISIGVPVVEALKPVSNVPLDVHLMIENPDQYIPQFANAGADIITVHIEASPHIHRTIQLIKDQGVRAGVAINPGTPVEMIAPILADVDLVLLMTVNPGFGGQSFIDRVTDKIQDVYKSAQEINPTVEIEVDGGINEETAKLCREAGANVLVAGSSVYKSEQRNLAIEAIRG
ncbi:ribulose-phosphate 3-epimerase [Texcoconibacillus texcoconensis]|uniref:Ribulose-phosphate 3-epimerase n=1 Tax=Texcoconibacillus texcoconensis TaxID=1095777 RepID=A0A840QL83_9BACI|nr:ribulose-phosphate 3-epimerase [Texcoconibacillus texcoconensis]MBB5172125.1 ribulose-phosphate 3-epimerase [Texcoconibacillus texcoconensis]